MLLLIHVIGCLSTTFKITSSAGPSQSLPYNSRCRRRCPITVVVECHIVPVAALVPVATTVVVPCRTMLLCDTSSSSSSQGAPGQEGVTSWLWALLNHSINSCFCRTQFRSKSRKKGLLPLRLLPSLAPSLAPQPYYPALLPSLAPSLCCLKSLSLSPRNSPCACTCSSCY